MPIFVPDERSLNEAESAFQRAFLENDVHALETLIHPEARYTGANGASISADVERSIRRAGMYRWSALEEFSRVARMIEGVGVTWTVVHLVGEVAGGPVDTTLSFTRVWSPSENGWVLVAAHGSGAPVPG